AGAGCCYSGGGERRVGVNRRVDRRGAREPVHIPKRRGDPDCPSADTRRIKTELGWSASVPIERGVEHMLAAIEYWRDAPVWTPASIAAATAEWFDYLGNRE